MKRIKSLLACILCLAVLCGCTARSEGEYYVEVPHADNAHVKEFPDQNSISSFFSLRNAVLNIIRSARTNETLRISDYTGNLDEDLKSITTEMTTENPLGMYAVSSILFEQTSILSYRKLKVTMQYRRATEEIRAVSEVLSMYDFERSLTDIFQSFGQGHVYSFLTFTDSEDTFRNRLIQCWTSNPAAAIGLSEIGVTNYPEDAQNRIVEISIKYLEETETLKKQRQQLEEAAGDICAAFTGKTEKEKMTFIYQYLRANVTYLADDTVGMAGAGVILPRISRYTAYGALIEHRASQAGMVLAAKLLCAQLGMTSQFVLGEKAGEPYCWLVVKTEGQTLHFDVTTSEYRIEAKPTEPGEETLPSIPQDSTTTTTGETVPEEETLPDDIFPSETVPAETPGDGQEVTVRRPIYLYTTSEATRRFSWDTNFYHFS
ncbi:MAG: hypothetical protein ABT01_04660 [Clostridium sp. SCN 57-10]|nr:MAG: hypothetical protein ABT01_04660 [Clostridium sp. SCN 57-10]